MPRKPRIQYTETDKALMWDRWRKGESPESIAQLFDRTHGSVAHILRQTGGIRPLKRVRSRRTLSLAEREEISRGVVVGRSLRSIAASINRAPSTISREINRNGGREHYRANVVDSAAWDRAHRPQTCKLNPPGYSGCHKRGNLTSGPD
jgi:IS30 family transposase